MKSEDQGRLRGSAAKHIISSLRIKPELRIREGELSCIEDASADHMFGLLWFIAEMSKGFNVQKWHLLEFFFKKRSIFVGLQHVLKPFLGFSNRGQNAGTPKAEVWDIPISRGKCVTTLSHIFFKCSPPSIPYMAFRRVWIFGDKLFQKEKVLTKRVSTWGPWKKRPSFLSQILLYSQT